MAAAGPFVFDIPKIDLKDVDTFALGILGMDRETVMEEFDDVYDDTLEKCLDGFSCQCMYKIIEIDRVGDDAIELAGGTKLESPLLAQMLKLADEVVCYALTVHGFDELIKNPINDMFDSMFYNAWGVGFSMSCHRWVKQHIVEQISEEGRYVGRGWTPGEDDLELSLQKDLFDLIDPSRIGIRLTESGLMSPMMSITGFIGISSDPAIEQAGADLPSCH